MAEVGDAIELTYETAPNATVTVTWRNTTTGITTYDRLEVPELLDDQGAPTGQYPIVLTGMTPGFWEAEFVSSGTADSIESFYERFEASAGPAPFATLMEYEELYGTLSEGRRSIARALLGRASKLIRDSFPRVDTRIADGTVAGDTVGLVVINMTAQVMRNIAGLRSETTGPFSRSYDPAAASGLLQLSDSDRALLAEAGLGQTTKRAKIGTARITGNLVPSARPGRRWPRGPYPTGW